MKVYVSKNELYPVYNAELPYSWVEESEIIEIEDALYERLEKMWKEFDACQKILEPLYSRDK